MFVSPPKQFVQKYLQTTLLQIFLRIIRCKCLHRVKYKSFNPNAFNIKCYFSSVSLQFLFEYKVGWRISSELTFIYFNLYYKSFLYTVLSQQNWLQIPQNGLKALCKIFEMKFYDFCANFRPKISHKISLVSNAVSLFCIKPVKAES